MALEADGHSVIEAVTARESIDKTALENPAPIILDLGLPDADGFSVLRAIRELSQGPVLVLSVWGQMRRTRLQRWMQARRIAS